MLVTKRDGSQEEYCVNKIKKCISWATNGLNVNPLELESKLSIQLKDTISTSLIHENSIQEALKLCTLESPDWRYVAGRLLCMAYLKKVSLGRKVYTKGSFLKSIIDKINNRIYSSLILETYTDKDINYYESFIIPDRDFDYDYAGVFALLNKYLVADELPQEMYLVVAMYLASNESNLGRRDELVENIYNALSLRKISLATPLLSNLRKPNGNLSSCFVLGIEDNIESIFDAIKDISLISKNGGGVGCLLSRIRASGSSVKGNANASGGIVPFAKIINDTGLAINQLGKRAAAITIGLDVWHLDILDFLHLQTEDGDQRRKAFDVFPQVIVPDLFMEAVQTNDDWLIFDPFEVREKTGYDFPKLWGVKFEVAYKHLKEIIKTEGNIKNFKIIKAKNIWLRILKTQVETGLPYIFFKDTANKYNPNKDSGFIGQTNLCVSPETKILTDKGQVQISDLVNQEVNIWNGSEWSNVIIKQTGTDQPLLKVHFSNGESIECTYYHNFWVQNKCNCEPKKVEAQNLKVGDKLIEYKLPDRDTLQSIKVTQVEYTNRVDDTYCCNEPKKHLIICNGIITGNCTESQSNFEPDKYTHCCNLVSINLANMLDPAEEKHIATLAVIILEAAIDLTEPPIPEAKAHNEYYRTIGVGFMGLADWLVKNNANYYIGKTITKNLFERYSFYCIEASVELAKKFGSFGAFEKSEWAKGNLLGRPLVWFLENTEDSEKWLELSNKVKEHGIRHSQLMAVAPNTSTSLLQGCTASILPPYNLFFYDSNAKGKYPIVPPYYNEESKWYYTENVKMDQKVLVDFIAEAIVPYIDSAVSMELNFNQNLEGLVNPKFISDTIFLAWKKECKTVYYVRSIPKKNSDDCVSCSG